jgi:hypothetical protein
MTSPHPCLYAGRDRTRCIDAWWPARHHWRSGNLVETLAGDAGLSVKATGTWRDGDMPWTANRSGSSRAPGACTSPRVGAGSLPYLARELGTDCGLIAPEMPDADNPHYQPWRDRMSRSLVRRLRPAELPRGGLIPEACPGLVPCLGSQLGPRRLDVRRIRGTERRWLEAARIEDLPVPRSR